MEEITQERGFLYRLLLLVRRGDRAGDRPRRYELHSMRRCEQPGHAFIGEDWTGEGGAVAWPPASVCAAWP